MCDQCKRQPCDPTWHFFNDPNKGRARRDFASDGAMGDAVAAQAIRDEYRDYVADLLARGLITQDEADAA
jgi:hypothetical protein